ncbi:MAG TPA: CoA transferase [Myxococcales bacterium]|nr:CoA transferase [Myxococcales bacterium]HIK84974.1 CoA transferase [Myxococcales bacterium]
MSGPFDGIKILDLSQVVSGPLATMLMADQGAEVTKIEPIHGSGDVTRLPSFAKGGLSAFYMNNNRGKRAISLDLTQEEGRKIALELAARIRSGRSEAADRAVDDLRIDGEDRFVSEPDSIAGARSKVLDEDVDLGRPVFDPIIQAVTGAISRQINPEVPMLDSFLYFFWPDGMMDKTMLDEDASPGFLLSTIYSLTETADGKMIYFVASDRQRHNLFKALGHPEWKEDPRFATMAASTQGDNLEQLGALIAKAFLELSTKEAMQRMLDNDVPCGAILDADQVLVDPQVVHNESLVTWQHPTAGNVRQPRPAARFSATPAEVARSAPVLGQHNDEVLAELGRSQDEIARLRKEGILG